MDQAKDIAAEVIASLLVGIIVLAVIPLFPILTIGYFVRQVLKD